MNLKKAIAAIFMIATGYSVYLWSDSPRITEAPEENTEETRAIDFKKDRVPLKKVPIELKAEISQMESRGLKVTIYQNKDLSYDLEMKSPESEHDSNDFFDNQDWSNSEQAIITEHNKNSYKTVLTEEEKMILENWGVK